jgi:hypothetical protein
MSIVTGVSFVGSVRTGAGSFSGTTGFKYAMAVDVEDVRSLPFWRNDF